MISYQGISDFLMTGCAITPVVAAAAGRPEIALLSHIVLLLAGIGIAALDRDAPFKQVNQSDAERD
jgi:hypothetical protein